MTSYLIIRRGSFKTDEIQHKSFNKFSTNIIFLEIVPVKVSNKNHFIYTNTFLDTGSDATLLTKDVAGRLGLTGSSKGSSPTNDKLKTVELDSKLVNFDIFPVSHPNKLKINTRG